jgi:hypothetical protein
MATFNLSYYRQLKQLVAKKESLITTDKDLFADPTFLELLALEASIESQVFYNHKNNYFALIQKYLNETIPPNIFRAQFINMVNEDLKKSQEILDNFEELSTFWIDLELDEFGSLFENIHETCLCAFEFEGQEDAMSETKFRDSIQKFFFKIQKYLDEG